MPNRPWMLAPIEPNAGAISVCVVLDHAASDQQRPFVTIDETLDAVGYLGCLADARYRPIQWVVLWLVKSPAPHAGADSLDLPASNLEVLRRWRAAWRSWGASHPEGARRPEAGTLGGSAGHGSRSGSATEPHADRAAIALAGDGETGPVLLLDRAGGAPVPLSFGKERLPLELCCDDALLVANDLPGYRSSTQRFLVARPPNGSPRFVWLSGETAPSALPTVSDAAEMDASRVLFNAGPGLLGAGPIVATPFDPVGFIDHSALLHGEPLRSALRFTPAAKAERADLESAASPILASWASASILRTPPSDVGRLFGSGDPRALRELEALYLRVRAVADMLGEVRDGVQGSGQPLFNISPESFSAEAPVMRADLPFLWQTRVRLARPGVARSFTVESDPPLRLFTRPPSSTIESLSPVVDASAFLGEVLLLDVTDAGPRRVSLKIQISPRQTVAVQDSDLLRFAIRVGEGLVPILARPSRSMTGRQPFEARSLPFSPPDTRAIKAGASVSVPIETVPLEGTPHDLYALFILACRMLLAGGHPTGAEGNAATEEAATLAALQRLIFERSGEGDGPEGMASPRGSGSHLARSAAGSGPHLGPRLFDSPASLDRLVFPAPLRASDGNPDTWPEGIPPELWSDVLRSLGAMRPGWPGCACRHFADFDPELPSAVFDASLAHFDSLARRLRVLLLGERAVDADIRQAARELLAGA